MLNIQPGQYLSATFTPPRSTRIPPSHAIPWIGSRNRWVANQPNPWEAHADGLVFELTAGSDGFATLEGKPLYPPELVVGIRALRGVVVEGPDGEATP